MTTKNVSRLQDETDQECFVIMPIGSLGGPIRSRSDRVFKHIIEPCARECGYEAIRADKISEPGMITRQIITKIIDAPMVVADMTGHNPNVFYELAIRHAYGKPVVKLIQAGESIPFDVGQSRTIFVDHKDLDSVEAARQELIRQIRASEKSPDDADNPVTEAVRLRGWQISDDPQERRDAEILGAIQDLSSRLARLENPSAVWDLYTNDRDDKPFYLIRDMVEDDNLPESLRTEAMNLWQYTTPFGLVSPHPPDIYRRIERLFASVSEFDQRGRYPTSSRRQRSLPSADMDSAEGTQNGSNSSKDD